MQCRTFAGHCARTAAFLAALWQPQWAIRAAEAPPFPQLVRDAEMTAPRLREIEADVGAAQGRAQQAAAFPNPTASVELEDFGGSGLYSGTGNSQSTVSLSEPLEIAGQRGARKAAGQAGLAAASARRVQGRADFGYDLALAYAGVEVALRRVALLTEDSERAQEDLRSARALVTAGKEGELRAVQAEAAAAATRAELEAARAGVVEALGRLSSMTGTREPFSGVAGSLLRVAENATSPAPAPVAMPRVATAEAEREWAERRLSVERRRAMPTPSLSIGTRRLRSDNANALVAGISLPLPLFDRNRGDIAAARAELSGAEARLDSVRLESQAEARTATAQVEASSSRLAASNAGAVAAREAYRLARVGYEAGRTPLIELLASRRALTEAELRLLDARLERVRALAALARLAGQIPFTE